jgi:hypothetical protein
LRFADAAILQSFGASHLPHPRKEHRMALSPGSSVPITGKPEIKKSRPNAALRDIFLAHLAQTANVAASSRAAGLPAATFYAERRRLTEFRAQWAEALGEGYAKLEAGLLAEALVHASAQTSDAMLKARAQKHRLALALLSAHRNLAKGIKLADAPAKASTNGKADLIAKLAQMQARKDGGSANEAPDPSAQAADIP